MTVQSQGICRQIVIHVLQRDDPSGVNFKNLTVFSHKSSMNICLFLYLLMFSRIMDTIGPVMWNSHKQLLVWKYVK